MRVHRRNVSWRYPLPVVRGPRALTLSAIAICVPVRNEVIGLPRLCDALERLHVPSGVALHLCLFLDSCVDGSDAAAEAFQRRSRHTVRIAAGDPGPPNAGRARHAAMRLGMDRADLLLTTDADSQPEPDWVTAMIDALATADVVAGRIVRTATYPNLLQDRIEDYYDALFAWRRRLDPVAWEAPRTTHCTGGANMGFRAAAYRALGGFPLLETGEDARLIDAAGLAGLRVRRDADCLVHTSDRRDGRTSGGLAAALRELDSDGDAGVRVAHPADAGWQYRMHGRARAAFAADAWAPLADALGRPAEQVRAVADESPNAEAFAMRIVPDPPGGMRTIAFAAAEADLARIAADELEPAT